MDVTIDYDSVERKPKIVSEYLEPIREYFSIEDKALVFLKKRTGRFGMPVRKYAIGNKGHFDLPFFKTLCDELVKNFSSLKINVTKALNEKLLKDPISNAPVNLKLTPRDYQHESAVAALQKGKGIIVLPTSAGKTLTIALISTTAISKNLKVLILVPGLQLVTQSYTDFIEYGVKESDVSKWTGEYEYSPTNIVIANNEILLSKKQDKTVLKRFDLVIVDECHKIATAQKISKLIKQLTPKYIFGLTGSLPESKFDIWSINRIFGPIIYQKQSLELRQDKFISNVKVLALQLFYKNIPHFSKPTMADPTAGYNEEINWLHTNNFRNSIISKLTNKLNTNTLILVDRIVHGEFLLKYLTANTDKQVCFIQGSVEVEEREKIRALMEQTSGIVCIAISKLFSTGISIKNLHNVIFAAIGKSKFKVIQSIGRSLRLHQSKNLALIFDIADVSLTYGNNHFLERTKFYDAEKIPVEITKLVEK
jgi:superfamily II DNA or RNA helicase